MAGRKEGSRGTARRCIFLLAAAIFVAPVACQRAEEWSSVEIDGHTYMYRQVAAQHTDLRAEPVNTVWLETRRCELQLSHTLLPFKARIIAAFENAAAKVASDLRCPLNGRRIPVFYLAREEHNVLSGCGTGGFMLNCYTDSQIVVIHAGMWRPQSDSLDMIANHEFTHYLCQILRGGPPLRVDKAGRFCFASYHDFEEAIAQSEEPRCCLEEDLMREAPRGNHVTLEEMDVTPPTDSNKKRQYLHMRALVALIRSRWGQDQLLEVVRSLGRESLMESIEATLCLPVDSIEAAWFLYMDSLRSDYVERMHAEGEQGDH